LKSRIVLATSGSMGDVHPYIAVGIGLRERGHHVTIATSEFYRPKVEGERLHFHMVRPDISPTLYTPDVFRKANDLRDGTRYLLKELVLPYVEHTYEDLRDGCRGADLLVSHPVMFPAPVVSEKFGVKWVSAVQAPGSFVSAHDPPVLPPLPALHHLRHLGPLPNALVYSVLDRATRPWVKPIDDLRKRLGLPRARQNPLHRGMYSPLGTLAWFSPALSKAQPDWPPSTQMTGFPFYDQRVPGEAMDRALADFVANGDAPVVFTLGTSAVLDPGGFYQDSFEAVRRLKCRAVFLTGPGGRSQLAAKLPENVYVCEYAPYSELFAKAAVIVHQGGIGTTAQALRAGVPMVVVPYLHDQPDNAFRVKRLGVARVVQRADYNRARAVEAIHALQTQPEYRRRAQELAARIQQEDGVRCAATVLEQYAARA